MIGEVFDVIKRLATSSIVSTMLLTLASIAKQGRAEAVLGWLGQTGYDRDPVDDRYPSGREPESISKVELA